MKNSYILGGLAGVTLVLSAGLAAAQAPPPGRADQSGVGAAEMTGTKPSASGTTSPSGGNVHNDGAASTTGSGRSGTMTTDEMKAGGSNAK
ncbi:MAG: hypothetical protein JWL62_1516 [Hyphomicrobiales bacterium]|nr:hypothetical protein [Hyphomicrobiales bacterium]